MLSMNRLFPYAGAALAACAVVSPAHAQETLAPLTPVSLRAALSGADNTDALAERVRAYFGAGRMATGAPPKVDNAPTGLTVAWAIDAPGLAPGQVPAVTTDDMNLRYLPLTRIGATSVYAGTAVLPRGLAGHWSYRLPTGAKGSGQIEDYPVNIEEKARPEVPKGKLTAMPDWNSTIFEGTSRSWWVYVPAQYKADKPAPVMIFQDGGGPKNWMPTVFDNMIAKGEIPPMVGIFINPGRFVADKKDDRSVEYDTVSDKYARFLLEEILPEVEKTTKLSHNPDDRALFGVSSGGICAFNVAWQRPDEFHKVDTCVGSFTNLQGGPTGFAGGNTIPAMIRKNTGWQHDGKPKPIKMFQTDGANDIDNAAGSWPLANQEIAKALDFGGYEHRFVFGNGFHGDRFGRYNMPDALRYLWSAPKQ